MKSLERRLQGGVLLSLVILMVLGWWGVSTLTRDIVTGLVTTRLEHDAESLLGALRTDTQGTPSLDDRNVGVIYHRPYSGHYFQIFTSGMTEPIRSRSLWDADLATPQLSPGEKETREVDGPDGQRLLLWSGGYRKSGAELTISVAEDLTPLLDLLSRLRWYFAAATLAALALFAGLQHWVIHTAFHPLRRVSVDIDELASGARSQLDESVPGEVRPLVVEVNRLLRLLDQRLQRSRNATGNLAHALKTPLTLLRRLAGSHELDACPHIQDQFEEQVVRLEKLIEVELKRARIAGEGTTGQRFRPGRDIPDLILVLEKAHSDKALAFETRIDGEGEWNLDRNDLLELLGTLLDNACKWAGRRVRCTAMATPNPRIVVEDDGPGCSPEQMEQLLRRGTRLDESTPGHGLGLAIAAELASAYGGKLQMSRSEELGGLAVSVEFGVQSIQR
ncbi:MAG: two-component system sensor histidine kinase CarS [Gammaproteobacteria bacterium]